ncbi:NAD(P)H-dependent glycerol-3-phosphate dehydrogenase [Salimicrobium flavidum]|uniref:Glycerol-3-phosphate dehydrogenase [NAD(P)+] n=1 Tax=Salimicrobium flavidum TaxID=570947 RepID=A0A1N7IJ83_9BACI|nr:NAD(P)H-dependent glycerol-3-phosphate dehydrogenase [Salimicrobium flavidum]SIS37112.1 glycerol 3-phosphate dehydrogenase (NAD(P)+) [Salimicrobium flavidum]
MAKITVLGAGSWGTALAMVLADNSHEVRLWAHRREHAEKMKETRENEKYLQDVRLPDNIHITDNLEESIDGVEYLLLAVPTKAVRDVCQSLKAHLDQPVTIIHAAKGIEPRTYKRVSEIIKEELPEEKYKSIVVLSGPSHAEEVAMRQPTTVTVSSEKLEAAEEVQELFINKQFRVYTSPDLVGVELGGSLKNIIALGAGISDGLGYGDNAKAALITRGLAEVARLGTSMGANPLTFSGLAGIGDLIVTCTSTHSRNWRAGYKLGKGEDLQKVLDDMGMVVEGVRTTEAAFQMAEEQEIDMPITSGIYHILFEEANPREVVEQLMTRVRRHEMEDLVDVLDQKMKD